MTERDYLFRCDYAKTNRSACKKCKIKIEKAEVRIAKLKTNPFSDDGGLMTDWHHPKCVFETFARARATTKKIESSDDIEHFDLLKSKDQDVIEHLIKNYLATRKESKAPSKAKAAAVPVAIVQSKLTKSTPASKENNSHVNGATDRLFLVVQKLCEKLRAEPSYLAKSEIVRSYFKQNPSSPDETYLMLKQMIPSVDKRVFNVKDKQLIKVLSSVFSSSLDDMSEHLEKGDVAETGRVFHIRSSLIKPQSSCVTMRQVDVFLEKLATITKEEEQRLHFKSILKHLTPQDLKYLLYLIKKDLRINAREKHILEGLHPVAYKAFQMSHDLRDVVNRYGSAGSSVKSGDTSGVGLQLMTPIRPMLAEACRSIAQALGKCPEGMYSEIKYDGERVQLHKQGSQFQFYSRSLKPVMAHKVADLTESVPKAFPTGQDIILDCEVLLVDNITGKPLPFGTLGIHKKSAFKAASVCLFVFDILLLNGKSLVNEPIKKRREILRESITEIPNRVMLSEMQLIKTASELAGMISHVLREGLEGLVLKGINTTYKPGARHWLKVKKDYLQGGAMADSADLVVLGGYLGTGNKGGMCSIFLMGCFSPASNSWKTVCKVGNGHDDATLEKYSNKMKRTGRKIKGDYSAIPTWLHVNKGIVPDFLVTDPKHSDVWEITGAEFSQSTVHTAAGISIRFPRITKIRDDKDWSTATNLPRLQQLMRTSQDKADMAIQQLMIKEGKLSVPKLLESPKETRVTQKRGALVATSFKEESPKKKLKPGSNANISSLHENSSHSKCSSSKFGPLPNIFKGDKIFVSSKIAAKEVLSRYVVAYGGEAVTNKELADVIVLSKVIPDKLGRIVTKQWIVNKINQ
ncbi:DNA ligase 3-like [Bolinopsis microptera]|uniref:DNA ligase 3-like n=1 Tax=Bolinopsis microptera TaxID=2820187 RepID=UPI003078C30C